MSNHSCNPCMLPPTARACRSHARRSTATPRPPERRNHGRTVRSARPPLFMRCDSQEHAFSVHPRAPPFFFGFICGEVLLVRCLELIKLSINLVVPGRSSFDAPGSWCAETRSPSNIMDMTAARAMLCTSKARQEKVRAWSS